MFPQGTTTAGVMVGWNLTEGDLTITGDGESGGPIEDEEGFSSFDTTTVFDLGVEGDYYLSDNWIVGARIEWRSNEPDIFTVPFDSITYEFNGEEYVTQHFALGLRYQFDPMGPQSRLRSFLGAELSYVPELETDFELDSSLNQEETIHFEGQGWYALGARGGMAILLTDDTVVEIGVLWEWPLGASEDIVIFGDGETGANPSRTKFELESDAIVGFVTIKGSI